MKSAKSENRKRKRERKVNPALVGACLLTLAVAFGILINLKFPPKEKAAAEEASPKVTVIPARPPATPTPTPTVSSLKVVTYGRELDTDGFTTYVGDKPIVLSVVVEPEMKHPPVFWSVSDSPSVLLNVSDDRMSCEFSALKPSGKIELIVSCYGAEAIFPVYLWER